MRVKWSTYFNTLSEQAKDENQKAHDALSTLSARSEQLVQAAKIIRELEEEIIALENRIDNLVLENNELHEDARRIE